MPKIVWVELSCLEEYDKSKKLSPQKFWRVFPCSVHSLPLRLLLDFWPFWLLLLSSRLLGFRFFSADAVMSRKVSRNWLWADIPPLVPAPCAIPSDIIYCKIISVLLLLCGCPDSCSKTKFFSAFFSFRQIIEEKKDAPGIWWWWWWESNSALETLAPLLKKGNLIGVYLCQRRDNSEIVSDKAPPKQWELILGKIWKAAITATGPTPLITHIGPKSQAPQTARTGLWGLGSGFWVGAPPAARSSTGAGV